MRGQLRFRAHVAFGTLMILGTSCFPGRASAAPLYHPINPTMADKTITLKLPRAIQALDESWLLLASDLVVGARWLDVRKVQDASRSFGAAPTAVWQAFRKISPLQPAQGAGPAQPAPVVALDFRATPASSFYPAGPAMPAGDQLAESKTPARQARQ